MNLIDADELLKLIEEDFNYLYSEPNEVISNAKSTVLMLIRERIEVMRAMKFANLPIELVPAYMNVGISMSMAVVQYNSSSPMCAREWLDGAIIHLKEAQEIVVGKANDEFVGFPEAIDYEHN
jgi:hypothetical protein